MNTLQFEKLKLTGARIGECGSIPPLMGTGNVQTGLQVHSDEEDELFVGYGQVPGILPYRHQDRYSRKRESLEFTAAVLENSYLKAVFLPELGGRLWQLYDKKSRMDLLYTNDVLQPCNLALRNAWFSGGVEWNIGMIGHSPFTFSPLHTAVLEGETPVLRMYEYERIRRLSYQMDFFLPEDSMYLHCRMRVVNSNNGVVPMYWWSNMAVPEKKDTRIVVPARETFMNEGGVVTKIPVPIREGKDFSYPVNTSHAMDYFFNIKTDRRYIGWVNGDGNGMLQVSTSRLKGRKLFVWGQGPGGRRWQQYLTDKAGAYCEIQAGLARTQYECLPMPPNTAWEWMEYYGPLSLGRENAHGVFEKAQKAVEDYIDTRPEFIHMEEELHATKETIALKKGRTVLRGSGYGALENRLRKKTGQTALPENLDFGSCDEEQTLWTELLVKGKVASPPARTPPSYMIQPEWKQLLQRTESNGRGNWWTSLQLGVLFYAEKDFKTALKYFRQSLAFEKTVWALCAEANAFFADGNKKLAAADAEQAVKACPEDCSIQRNMWAILLSCGKEEWIIDQARRLYQNRVDDARCRFYLARALLAAGRIEEAESILTDNGGLEIPDIREGETLTSDLWYEIQEKKAEREGRAFSRRDAVPPPNLNFQMHTAE